MSLSQRSYWPLLHLLVQDTECTLISRKKIQITDVQAQKPKALEDDIEDPKKRREYWSRYLRACRRMLTSLQKKLREKLAP